MSGQLSSSYVLTDVSQRRRPASIYSLTRTVTRKSCPVQRMVRCLTKRHFRLSASLTLEAFQGTYTESKTNYPVTVCRGLVPESGSTYMYSILRSLIGEKISYITDRSIEWQPSKVHSNDVAATRPTSVEDERKRCVHRSLNCFYTTSQCRFSVTDARYPLDNLTKFARLHDQSD